MYSGGQGQQACPIQSQGISLSPHGANLVQQQYGSEGLPLREMMKHSEGSAAHARWHDVSLEQVPPSCQQQSTGMRPECEAEALATVPEGSHVLRF